MEKKFNILFATDYSEVAFNAGKFAVQFAKATNSTLFILHVYDIPFSSTPSNPNEFVRVKNDSKNAETMSLEQHKSAIFGSLNMSEKEVDCVCNAHMGNTVSQILNEANEINADFIVTGTHGASKFHETFLGSHSWSIVKKTDIPVLCVPANIGFSTMKNILFASEYREGELPVIKFIVHFAKLFDAQVTILHINKGDKPNEQELAKFNKFKSEVMKGIPYFKLYFRNTTNNDITEGLKEFCQKLSTDLLIMSPEKTFLVERIFSKTGSITKKMTFHTTIPLLTIPDFYNPDYAKFWKVVDENEKIEIDDF